MPLFRILSYLVLVLALVAGGVAPGFAQEAHPVAEAPMHSPCHGMDGERVDVAPEPVVHADCCDAGDCRCDCLQHTPAGVAALRQLAQIATARQPAQSGTPGHVPARTLPATRPPIA
ncbi:CopL family metal-binding regulatory protein [Arenimonas donghaensis]|uniref:CopL family metal-binding regulatory protein n=1 Tax=Arenimonas donghaensis DSM 18148 = HO3-R19 TaxID=1121014 RepID=A0A087MLW1_9GAMM|nr:CopL family metal-binding regulatory protein [Arenimonas donghaensis]KFL37864.1 hypothetical protein N788_01465 [Arenimonas donghaensis DSM 18148 = HO3-R19]